mgnify:CR=1 FL=1
MNEKIKQRFCQQLGDECVRFEEPMCDHTTFRIGGPAEVFVMPESYEQIAWVIRQCRQEAIPYFILGNGSNLLVSDSGIARPVIQLDGDFTTISRQGNTLRCGAGASLIAPCRAAAENSLSGVEWGFGIPGSFHRSSGLPGSSYFKARKDPERGTFFRAA